jgi:hypothetical protein
VLFFEVPKAQSLAPSSHSSWKRMIVKRTTSQMRHHASHVGNAFSLNAKEYEPRTTRYPSLERYLRDPQKARRIGSSGESPKESEFDQIDVRVRVCPGCVRVLLDVGGLPLCDAAIFSAIVPGLRYMEALAVAVAQMIVVMSPMHGSPQ